MSNNSPAPGTPQTGTKSIVAGVGAFAAAFITYWIADVDPFTAKEIGQAALLGAASAGLLGGATYAAKNSPK